jgi:hypothetical protein
MFADQIFGYWRRDANVALQVLSCSAQSENSEGPES